MALASVVLATAFRIAGNLELVAGSAEWPTFDNYGTVVKTAGAGEAKIEGVEKAVATFRKA